MNTNALLSAVVIWLVCAFAALVYLARRIASVRKDTKNAIEQVIEKTNERLHKFDDSYSDSLITLSKRVGKLEESEISIPDTNTDEVGKTSLYAITKDGYSTIIVSLTEDERAVIDSFIDWACLDDDFTTVKIDKNYTAEEWRNNK